MTQNPELEVYLAELPEFQTKEQTRVFLAALPPKEDRPELWEHKVNSWTDAIVESSKILSNFVITSEELRNRFKKDGLRSNCIDEVMIEMENRKLIVNASSIASSATVDGWGSWLFDNLVKKPLFSFGSPLKMFSPSKTDSQQQPRKEGKYVILSQLKERAETLLSEYDNQVILIEYLWEKQQQQQQESSFSNNNDIKTNNNNLVTPSKSTLIQQSIMKQQREQFDLVLNYLVSQRKAFYFTFGRKENDHHNHHNDNNDESLKRAIKFSSGSVQVTDVEKGILEMEYTIEKLEQQAKQLESDIISCKKQALEHNRKNLKKEAIVFLKRSKRLQSIYTKRLQSMDTIREILEKIDDAKTNKDILEAYSIGASSLRQANQGITPEAASDVMEDLMDVMADQREIDEVMQNGAQDVVASYVDQSEIDEEFDRLMTEVTMEQFPSIPSDTPKITGTTNATTAVQDQSPNVSTTAAKETEDDELLQLMNDLSVLNLPSPKAEKTDKEAAFA